MLQRGFITHVVSADQGSYSLQRAEGVILAIRLAIAGIPDQVVVLLISQDIRRGSLRRKEAANISSFAQRHVKHTDKSCTSGIAQPIISQAFFFINRK